MNLQTQKNKNQLLDITNDICSIVEGKPTRWWKVSLYISLFALLIGILSLIRIFTLGLGELDLSNNIVWGVVITNFVFWIGLSHAGTFISAILLLLRQQWRRAINRSAEALTIIAIIIACIMPIIHLGKPELFYTIIPLTNKMGYPLVNFNSPLTWDFFAIMAYFIVSIVFFRFGLLPDFAVLRDRAKEKRKKNIYNLLAAGWTGSITTWVKHKKTMYLLAGLATCLVISVHSIVSLDFAVTIKSGWHSTIFPIYFVFGAILSGFAMISTLAVFSRKIMNLKQYIGSNHLGNMNKIILFTGTILIFIYLIDLFSTWYSGNRFEQYTLIHKMLGHHWWIYFIMLSFVLILPQLFWSKKLRTNSKWTLVITILINIGMWMERFIIIVTSSETAYLESGWSNYLVSFTAIGIIIGSIGFFFTCYLLLIKNVPFISMYEIKESKEIQLNS